MAAGNWIMFGNAELRMKDGTIEWGVDAFRMALLTNAYTPSLEHTAWSSLSGAEVANGNGYATHGKLLAVTEARTNQVVTLDGDDQSWTGATFSAKYAAIVHDADGNGALAAGDIPIAYCDLDTGGGSLSPVAGTLSITIHTSGLMTYTVASS